MSSYGALTSDRYFPEGSRKVAIKLPHDRRVEVLQAELMELPAAIPENVSNALWRVSQLGLKEMWLEKEPGGHNRWEHSRGVFTVGSAWLKVLRQDDRVPSHCLPHLLRSWDQIEHVAATALLLHDCGHLPFSHLLEEVLASINWMPSGARNGGLEVPVLRKRLRGLDGTWDSLANKTGISQPDASAIVEALILGQFGVPWLQTIVNSPLDADKIDYIQYDSALLEAYPVRTRLQQAPGKWPWLEEFVQDQTVNHAGLLCLNGRSARAAADLWRDRIFLFDRFYQAPELRVPERLCAEIVQQFLIRSTMSAAFRRSSKLGEGSNVNEELGAAFLEGHPDPNGAPKDPIEEKFQVTWRTMETALQAIRTPRLEYDVLMRMGQDLVEFGSLADPYREFLMKIMETLRPFERGEERSRVRGVSEDCLVGEPLLFHRDDADRIREALRPLQHTYSTEVILDIACLPRVLSAPGRTAGGAHAEEGFDHGVLVPAGPASTWIPGSRASVPLSDAAVEEIERPFCRVMVISPLADSASRLQFVFDRVRSALIDAGIERAQHPAGFG